MQSFVRLADILGHPVTTFCYPYGGHHTFTADTVGLLKTAGATFCFNVDPRDVTVEDLTNRLQALPRYDCNMFPYGRASTGTVRARQSETSGLRVGADAAGLSQ
jgi:hypothetical protein